MSLGRGHWTARGGEARAVGGVHRRELLEQGAVGRPAWRDVAVVEGVPPDEPAHPLVERFVRGGWAVGARLRRRAHGARRAHGCSGEGGRVGATWASRYDGLRFNTSRGQSALPGAPFPRTFGQFPTRDQYVDYLRSYAHARDVRIELDCEVTALEYDDDSGWLVSTNGRPRITSDVVIATGIFNRPSVPYWASRGSFSGPVLHSSAYRNATPFAGRDVVVVGGGRAEWS
jgi:cation diffusion facilitator CzcD-associated flavoprotein CzcO